MIRLRPGLEAEGEGRIRTFLDPGALTAGECKEIGFYHGVSRGVVRGELFDHLASKAGFVRVFRELAGRVDARDGMAVLELGAGRGWASCLLKRDVPGCHVVCSDLCADQLWWAEHYEALVGVRLDELWALSVRDLPFADAQFDRVFAFAAFHHFGERGDFSAALGEILRVLRPGGRAVFLYETHAPAWAARLLRRRAVRERGGHVDEDVLVLARLREACRGFPCELRVEYHPGARFREDPKVSLYMAALGLVPALAPLVPCTVNLTLIKAAP